MENKTDKTISTYIPADLYNKLMFKLAEDKLSYHGWLIKMIYKYVTGGENNGK